jgi:hypothetical protein
MQDELKDFAKSWESLEYYVREKDYQGFSKFDALNSPLLNSLSKNSEILRLIFTQIVNRVPLPLREAFKVTKTRNPKGIANFIRGYSKMAASGHPEFKNIVIDLSDWLISHDSQAKGQYSGPGRAWGYSFPWQSPAFFAPAYSPNCIVTAFCAEALLDAGVVTGQDRFFKAAQAASRFILEGLPILESTEESLCIGYVQGPLKWKVININAVAAGFLSRLALHENDKKLMAQAARMIEWVFTARKPGSYCWDYTWPLSQSGIGPDNYHTGGILDGIFDYMSGSGNWKFKKEYLKAVSDYERSFFTPSGAPKWRRNRNYPHDIHGAAQGIITFTRAGALEPEFHSVGRRIALWTINEMQDRKTGRFYYQKWPFFTWKLDLMRWNNSWMFRAFSDLLTAAR